MPGAAPDARVLRVVMNNSTHDINMISADAAQALAKGKPFVINLHGSEGAKKNKKDSVTSSDPQKGDVVFLVNLHDGHWYCTAKAVVETDGIVEGTLAYKSDYLKFEDAKAKKAAAGEIPKDATYIGLKITEVYEPAKHVPYTKRQAWSKLKPDMIEQFNTAISA